MFFHLVTEVIANTLLWNLKEGGGRRKRRIFSFRLCTRSLTVTKPVKPF